MDFNPNPSTYRNSISVVIPTYNEAGNIGRLLKHLKRVHNHYLLEIIVADGGSKDATLQEAREAGAMVVISSQKGRAFQMNAGTEKARGDIIYFLHADTFPPENYDRMIVQSISDHQPWGSFRFKFDQKHWLLSFLSWVVQFNFTFFHFGDQSLFIKKDLFHAIGKFNTSRIIFEDTEIAERLRQIAKGKILPDQVITSARKFRVNGVYKMSFIFTYLWVLYLLGMPHDRMLRFYKRWIVQGKI